MKTTYVELTAKTKDALVESFIANLKFLGLLIALIVVSIVRIGSFLFTLGRKIVSLIVDLSKRGYAWVKMMFRRFKRAWPEIKFAIDIYWIIAWFIIAIWFDSVVEAVTGWAKWIRSNINSALAFRKEIIEEANQYEEFEAIECEEYLGLPMLNA